MNKDHFIKQDVVAEGESDVVSKMHAEMLGAGPLSPIQVRFIYSSYIGLAQRRYEIINIPRDLCAYQWVSS